MKLVVQMEEETDLATISGELILINKIVKAVSSIDSGNDILSEPKVKRKYVFKKRGKFKVGQTGNIGPLSKLLNKDLLFYIEEYISTNSTKEREALRSKYKILSPKNHSQSIYSMKKILEKRGIDWQ